MFQLDNLPLETCDIEFEIPTIETYPDGTERAGEPTKRLMHGYEIQPQSRLATHQAPSGLRVEGTHIMFGPVDALITSGRVFSVYQVHSATPMVAVGQRFEVRAVRNFGSHVECDLQDI